MPNPGMDAGREGVYANLLPESLTGCQRNLTTATNREHIEYPGASALSKAI
jgi:hypothetical protein